MKAVVNSFLGGDFGDALIELINTRQIWSTRFLNGGRRWIWGRCSPAIGVLPISPTPGVSLTDVEVAMGGLLSKEGGSLFNALGLGVTIGDTAIPDSRCGPGAIGSLIGLGGAFAQAIGWVEPGSPLPTIPVPGPGCGCCRGCLGRSWAADDADVAGADDSAASPDLQCGQGHEQGAARQGAALRRRTIVVAPRRPRREPASRCQASGSRRLTVHVINEGAPRRWGALFVLRRRG